MLLYTKLIILVKKEVNTMKLSTRGRYGTRALLELALHQEEGPVLLKDIAQRQQISQRYLEHLITPLVARGYGTEHPGCERWSFASQGS